MRQPPVYLSPWGPLVRMVRHRPWQVSDAAPLAAHDLGRRLDGRAWAWWPLFGLASAFCWLWRCAAPRRARHSISLVVRGALCRGHCRYLYAGVPLYLVVVCTYASPVRLRCRCTLLAGRQHGLAMALSAASCGPGRVAACERSVLSGELARQRPAQWLAAAAGAGGRRLPHQLRHVLLAAGAWRWSTRARRREGARGRSGSGSPSRCRCGSGRSWRGRRRPAAWRWPWPKAGCRPGSTPGLSGSPVGNTGAGYES